MHELRSQEICFSDAPKANEKLDAQHHLGHAILRTRLTARWPHGWYRGGTIGALDIHVHMHVHMQGLRPNMEDLVSASREISLNPSAHGGSHVVPTVEHLPEPGGSQTMPANTCPSEAEF